MGFCDLADGISKTQLAKYLQHGRRLRLDEGLGAREVMFEDEVADAPQLPEMGGYGTEPEPTLQNLEWWATLGYGDMADGLSTQNTRTMA